MLKAHVLNKAQYFPKYCFGIDDILHHLATYELENLIHTASTAISNEMFNILFEGRNHYLQIQKIMFELI